MAKKLTQGKAVVTPEQETSYYITASQALTDLAEVVANKQRFMILAFSDDDHIYLQNVGMDLGHLVHCNDALNSKWPQIFHKGGK